ncbi:hypothetical protein PRR77_27345, partial [Klebsiella pneumoniae]|nr:hypothetical protein [Klebsiella pneumoniae]
IVVTGLSGSGKSSLAFDTLYAEGQRRYVESLSAYARQFLSLMRGYGPVAFCSPHRYTTSPPVTPRNIIAPVIRQAFPRQIR